MTDRNGHTTTYAYDVQNRLIRTTDALGHTSYDHVRRRGQPAFRTPTPTATPRPTSTTPSIAAPRSTDALSEVTQWGYDLTGLPGHPECTGPTLGSNKVTKHTDANGKVIYYCYDGLDRLNHRDPQAGQHGVHDYLQRRSYLLHLRCQLEPPDARPNPTATPPPIRTTPLNRQVKMVNAAGDTTLTTYDPVGNVHSTTTPNSNVMTNTYDALNRLVQQVGLAGTRPDDDLRSSGQRADAA